MEVINVNADKYTDVEKFLKTIPGIKLDVEVIMNASLLMKDDEIVGIISFECFGRTGLIRYFIFKQLIDEKTLQLLFNNLISTASSKGITKIIAFVANTDTIPIFEFLGFTKTESKQVYIDEKKYPNEKSAFSEIYQYEV